MVVNRQVTLKFESSKLFNTNLLVRHVGRSLKSTGYFQGGETVWETVARLCPAFSEKMVTKCTVPVGKPEILKKYR